MDATPPPPRLNLVNKHKYTLAEPPTMFSECSRFGNVSPASSVAPYCLDQYRESVKRIPQLSISINKRFSAPHQTRSLETRHEETLHRARRTSLRVTYQGSSQFVCQVPLVNCTLVESIGTRYVSLGCWAWDRISFVNLAGATECVHRTGVFLHKRRSEHFLICPTRIDDSLLYFCQSVLHVP